MKDAMIESKVDDNKNGDSTTRNDNSGSQFAAPGLARAKARMERTKKVGAIKSTWTSYRSIHNCHNSHSGGYVDLLPGASLTSILEIHFDNLRA
jgi:hypothetical protein